MIIKCIQLNYGLSRKASGVGMFTPKNGTNARNVTCIRICCFTHSFTIYNTCKHHLCCFNKCFTVLHMDIKTGAELGDHNIADSPQLVLISMACTNVPTLCCIPTALMYMYIRTEQWGLRLCLVVYCCCSQGLRL